jgi:hypothetical protein
MLATSRKRVAIHTSREAGRDINQRLEQSIRHFSAHPNEIDARLRALDAEWDIERAIEANASALAFTGVALGAAHDRRWLLLPALVTAFLFQHAVQGWCPPVPILRRLGFRTAYEIEQERQMLKALRGDFARLAPARRSRSRRASRRVLPRAKAKAIARAARA